MNREVAAQAATVLDTEDLMARCLGNLEFAERVLAMFQQRGNVDLAELEQAVAAEDIETVTRIAHRLKGASANVAAPGLRATAAEIEQAARQRSVEEIPAHLAEFRREWERFTSAASLAVSLPEHAN
jgi:two-component system sensor histidine kinase/response regulator